MQQKTHGGVFYLSGVSQDSCQSSLVQDVPSSFSKLLPIDVLLFLPHQKPN